MKSLIRWAIKNTPAMNTLMVAIMLVGTISVVLMNREVFPEFELEIVLVQVPYPGASPEEVEEGICQKIEEAVQAIEGIKKLNAVAAEGMGSVILELHSDVPDVQKIVNDVRSEIETIPSFPVLAEDPEVSQVTLRQAALRIGVVGPDDESPEAELRLREVAEHVRKELLQLPSITQANILGAKEYQIDIEISEDRLREYGLTLRDVAAIVRDQNLELPGGKIKTDAQEVLVRGKDKQVVGEKIANIPLITREDGVVLTIDDLGNVRDQFADETSLNRINGRPAMVISVDKSKTEDLLAIVEESKLYIDYQNKMKQRGAVAGGNIGDGGDSDDGLRLSAEGLKEELEKKTGQLAQPLPKGFELVTWADRSTMVEDRLDMLARNGLQGLIAVFVVLSIFLEKRLAFWVSMGIPISMLGACAILFAMGETMNMLSMFAFLMALGILVDDAIVVGENVYHHRQQGKSFIEAAVEGTYEVMPSVIASVSTTIIAFMPLLFVPGVMGKFIAVMPLAVIAMLALSLIESTFILPCHLAEDFDLGFLIRFLVSIISVVVIIAAPLLALGQTIAVESAAIAVAMAAALGVIINLPIFGWVPPMFGWINGTSDGLLGGFVKNGYLPFLGWSLSRPYTVFAAGASCLLISVGLYNAGVVRDTAFPKLDADNVIAQVTYPNGTPATVGAMSARRLEQAMRNVDQRYAKDHGGEGFVKLIHLAVGDINMTGEIRPGMEAGGAHTGKLSVELVQPEDRDLQAREIIDMWREETRRLGGFPGAEDVVFDTMAMGPGGTPIEFKILGEPAQMAKMEAAVEQCKQKLATYDGVYDISDNSRPGKPEFQIKIKEAAQAMGLTLQDVAGTVRASYYGEEAMRLQRGRHEVKLMVRYPQEERRSLSNFDEIRVRAKGGAERPLTEIADVNVTRGYSSINRLDQLRAITITANLDESKGNAGRIISNMKANFIPDLQREFPGLQVRWEGQAEQTEESVAGLMLGLAVALAAMFGLLTLQFRSYWQPMLIMAIIPFGTVGAVAGHIVMQLDITLFSLFGLVALTGVVVNDSIVLIDFINHRVRDGLNVREALLDAGARRLRPVLLTSATTIAGLLPILLETSFQAQVLIPMATSLCFGLMFATLMVLLLVPTFYLIYFQLVVGDHEVHPDYDIGDAAVAATADAMWEEEERDRQKEPAVPVPQRGFSPPVHSEEPAVAEAVYDAHEDDWPGNEQPGDGESVQPTYRESPVRKIASPSAVGPGPENDGPYDDSTNGDKHRQQDRHGTGNGDGQNGDGNMQSPLENEAKLN